MSHLIKSWNGQSIRIRADRYVCLTDMANATGNRVNNWTQLKSTHSYVEALVRVTGLPATALLQVNQGGVPELQGTWGHPKVALRFAQWCNDDFAVQVDCWIDELLTTGSVQLQQQQTQAPYFYRRMQTFRQRTGKIPTGYFCIFSETIELISQLELHGFELPEHLIIDISIGKCFCNYMRSTLEIEPKEVCLKYPHFYPGAQYPVDAYLYPDFLLATFRKWFDAIYCHKQLLRYLKANAPEALGAAHQFLGLLPGS